jgi:hypothetical protein
LSLSGYGFIVGLTEDRKTETRIKEESDLYGDILQINVIDHYFNLTYKVVGLLNWIDSRCSKVDFVLKVDDDVFINVHNLEAVMKSLDPSEKSVYGSRADSIPLRDRYSMFYKFPVKRRLHFLSLLYQFYSVHTSIRNV